MGSIKIVKRSNDPKFSYSVYAIFNLGEATEIKVSMGLKGERMGLHFQNAVYLSESQSELFQRALNVAQDLMRGRISIATDPNWEFKPQRL
jgi:hypothetical protein